MESGPLPRIRPIPVYAPLRHSVSMMTSWSKTPSFLSMAFGWNTDSSHDTDAKRSGKPSNYAIANASCLEFARKRPLNWWLDKGIKEGVALMLCNSVKRWRDWRSAEAGKSRKVERVVNAIGMDEYRVITVCPSEKPVDDLLPDLPMLGPLPYMYDTELLPFSDDIDGL